MEDFIKKPCGCVVTRPEKVFQGTLKECDKHRDARRASEKTKSKNSSRQLDQRESREMFGTTTEAQAEELLKALEAAYTLILRIPHGDPLRINSQHTYCVCRDALAAANGDDAEYTQNFYEAKAALANCRA